MGKDPVGAGTFRPSHMLVFYIPPCRKVLHNPVQSAGMKVRSQIGPRNLFESALFHKWPANK
jgi:hypothetical protein